MASAKERADVLMVINGLQKGLELTIIAEIQEEINHLFGALRMNQVQNMNNVRLYKNAILFGRNQINVNFLHQNILLYQLMQALPRI